MPQARCARVHIAFTSLHRSVVPGRVELPTSTLSVWRSNQLSYRTSGSGRAEGRPARCGRRPQRHLSHSIEMTHKRSSTTEDGLNHHPAPSVTLQACRSPRLRRRCPISRTSLLQKGGVPAAPSGTATLLRLSPNHQFYPRPVIPVFRHPRLSWLDGRCVQGPGTYSPRHG